MAFTGHQRDFLDKMMTRTDMLSYLGMATRG